jgi:hypothetical protein
MCSIVDNYAHGTEIARQDVDLLPWTLEETEVDITRQDEDLLPWQDTEVIKEAMRSPKKTKTEKKDKKKDKKYKRKDKKEEAASAKSNGYNKRPTLLKGQMDSLTSLDSSGNDSSGSLDASSSSLNQDNTQHHHESADHLLMIKVEIARNRRREERHLLRIKVKNEHKRRREERRRKREVANKKSMPEVDMQDKRTADDRTLRNMKADRLERAFLWYTRMATPTRTEFKRKVAAEESIDITPEDVDLLPWNLTGRFVNIATINAILRVSILEQSATH